LDLERGKLNLSKRCKEKSQSDRRNSNEFKPDSPIKKKKKRLMPLGAKSPDREIILTKIKKMASSHYKIEISKSDK
jgi:hypothetical protein